MRGLTLACVVRTFTSYAKAELACAPIAVVRQKRRAAVRGRIASGTARPLTDFCKWRENIFVGRSALGTRVYQNYWLWYGGVRFTWSRYADLRLRFLRGNDRNLHHTEERHDRDPI
jgi:hypothetical protein